MNTFIVLLQLPPAYSDSLFFYSVTLGSMMMRIFLASRVFPLHLGSNPCSCMVSTYDATDTYQQHMGHRQERISQKTDWTCLSRRLRRHASSIPSREPPMTLADTRAKCKKCKVQRNPAAFPNLRNCNRIDANSRTIHEKSVLGRILAPAWGAAGSQKALDTNKYKNMQMSLAQFRNFPHIQQKVKKETRI